MKILTLEEEWKRYMDTLYPEGVSDLQERECKQAFFAGAINYNCMLDKIADNMGEEEGAPLFQKLQEEMRAYCQSRAEYFKSTGPQGVHPLTAKDIPPGSQNN